jgi:hypothetical protein
MDPLTTLPKDQRIVCGIACSWWDSIDKAGGRGPLEIPCCPFCGGVLFEFEDANDWFSRVDKYDREHPGNNYRGFIEWLRGKCYKSLEVAKLEWFGEKTRKNS